MGNKCCNKKCGLISVGVIGLILVIIGAIAVAVFDLIYVDLVKQETLIAPGTVMYDQWEVVSTPTYMSYYFYNITNYQEIIDAYHRRINPVWIKPHMVELGPYTYREYLSKDNISFLDVDPEQVFYRQKTVLIFDPDNSVGSLDDRIYTINFIAVSLPGIQQHFLANLTGTVVNRLLQSNSEIIFNHTVEELLFGFSDPLLDILGNLVGQDITFGLFATSNKSAGWFNYQVYTGKHHPELTNIITTYEGKTELDYWTGDSCNMINGTDGTTTPPFMEREETIYFFVDDICRSIYAVYELDEKIKRIPAWKFTIPPEAFQSPDSNPDNWCYCPDPNNTLCHLDGAVPISECMFGAPVLVSSPHFLYGSEFYMNQTTGISPPNKEEHETALVYEPNTGTGIKLDKRLQINFLIQPYPDMGWFNAIDSDVVIPVVWLNESGTVTDSDANLMYSFLVVPGEVVAILQIVLCCVGSIMVLIPLFYALLHNYTNKTKKGKKGVNPKANGTSNSAYDTDISSKSAKL